jgi:hypothetical protein
MSETAIDARSEFRRQKLRQLIDELFSGRADEKGRISEFAHRVVVSPGYISNVLSAKKPFGERAALGICARLSLPPTYFEQPSKPLTIKEKSALSLVDTTGLTPDVVSLARRIGSLDQYWRRAVDSIVAIAESVPSEAAAARRKRR